MIFNLNRTARYWLAGLAVVVIGKLAWAHRDDEWVRQLVRPGGPAKVDIQFDNGSVREVAVPAKDQPTGATNNPAVKNVAGVLKKCLLGKKVIYTDQVCPAGAKVAPVNGGSVAVLESQKPRTNSVPATQNSRQRLHDALDISGGDNLKDKMMERTIGQ